MHTMERSSSLPAACTSRDPRLDGLLADLNVADTGIYLDRHCACASDGEIRSSPSSSKLELGLSSRTVLLRPVTSCAVFPVNLDSRRAWSVRFARPAIGRRVTILHLCPKDPAYRVG